MAHDQPESQLLLVERVDNLQGRIGVLEEELTATRGFFNSHVDALIAITTDLRGRMEKVEKVLDRYGG